MDEIHLYLEIISFYVNIFINNFNILSCADLSIRELNAYVIF